MVLLSSLLAVFLQVLTVKLGIATKRDLAQLCAEVYSPQASAFLWVTAEIAIAACDLAEVIGSAIALQLLFGLPIIWGACVMWNVRRRWEGRERRQHGSRCGAHLSIYLIDPPHTTPPGCCLTALDVLLVLSLFDGRPDSPTSSRSSSSPRGNRGRFRLLEAAVALLILVIFVCFAVEVALSKPSLAGVLRGFFLPDIPALVTDGPRLYIAMGILGATVRESLRPSVASPRHVSYLPALFDYERKGGHSQPNRRFSTHHPPQTLPPKRNATQRNATQRR